MKVQYYTKSATGKSPVQDFIGSLALNDQKHIARRVDKLEQGQFNAMCKTKDVKPITSEKNLYELRPPAYRLLFTKKDLIYRVLHIFKKQGNKKGYPGHIQKAKNNDKQWDKQIAINK